jgi:rod shape-determining protein MreB
MDEAIIRYVRRTHGLIIGENNAERIKIEAGSALVQADGRQVEIHIEGRELHHGHMKSIVLGPQDLVNALAGPVQEMAEFIERALEDLPPKIAEEVAARGIVLTGGGALLERLDEALEQKVGVRFLVPSSPMHCVIKGTAAVLEALPEHRHLLIRP